MKDAFCIGSSNTADRNLGDIPFATGDTHIGFPKQALFRYIDKNMPRILAYVNDKATYHELSMCHFLSSIIL
jgi:hypothetical protein